MDLICLSYMRLYGSKKTRSFGETQRTQKQLSFGKTQRNKEDKVHKGSYQSIESHKLI